MILSLTHHAAHAHHLGRAVAAITLAAASTVGLVQTHSADPVARVSVSRTVEAPAPEPAATPSTWTAPAGGATGTQAVTNLGVTVPTREEILAQCAAAGLTAECVSAGLR